MAPDKHDDGGRAHPFPCPGHPNGEYCGHHHAIEEGMTLLDYFAGQALAGMTARQGLALRHEDASHAASLAYSFAAAMVAEKRRRESGA